jgi:hypothetical protein
MTDKAVAQLDLEGAKQTPYCHRLLAYHKHSLQPQQSLSSSDLSSLQLVLDRLPQCQLLQKLQSRCRRMQDLWQACARSCSTCRDITVLDGLTGTCNSC